MDKKMFSKIRFIYHELLANRDLLAQMVDQQLTLRYRRTVLGYFWTVLNPVLMMSIMALVFSALLKSDFREFIVFLFAGMIPWNFFNSVATQSCNSIVTNEALIKKIYLPKLIFPVSVAIALLVDSMLSLIFLFLVMLVFGAKISWALVFIPFAYVLVFTFSLGIGIILSVMTVFFRDLQYIVSIAMQGLFFLSPVLYRHDALGGGVAWVVSINPIGTFISLFRHPLVNGELPTLLEVCGASAMSLITLFSGLAIFKYYDKKIVYRL